MTPGQKLQEMLVTFLEWQPRADGEPGWSTTIDRALAPIRVRTRGEAGQVELHVFNDGPPIADEVLPHLFKPMQQGAPSQGALLGRSVGLGLYIVKHIVDGLGGTVDVRSSAEAGTTFKVVLPRTES